MTSKRRLTRVGSPCRNGFTLVELMIVVAVVAILAGVAFPSYQEHVRKARRSDGKEALLRLQIEQERWRTNNASYASSPATLGLGTASVEGYYTIGITSGSATATGYTATATATGVQTADTGCTTLTLTVGSGSEQRTPATCW